MPKYTIMVASAENADGRLPDRTSFNCGPSLDDVAAYTVMPYSFSVTGDNIWRAAEGVSAELALQPGDVIVVDGEVCFQVLPNTVADLDPVTISDLDATMTLRALAIALGRPEPM